MGRETRRYVSLDQAKDTRFGEVLRGAIKAEFGSASEFAKFVGKTEGAISQLITGPQEPTPTTLRWLLTQFNTPAWQEAIYEAWRRDFAPPPEFNFRGTHADAIEQIREIDQAGNPRRALAITVAGRKEADDPVAWQRYTEEAFQINLRLTRTAPALRVLSEMRERARARDDKASVSAALWMEGTAVRNLESITVEVLTDRQNIALEYLNAWSPDSAEEKETWSNRFTALERDRALDFLAVHDRSPVSKELLIDALRSLERSMRLLDSKPIYTTGLEVRARVETALGRPFKAEETLEELAKIGAESGTDLKEKMEIARARILMLRGERDEAIHIFEHAAKRAFDLMNLHHHRKADQLAARLRAGL